MLSCELDVGYSVGGIERGLGLREALCLVERELVLMGLVHLVISYLERHRVLVVRTFGSVRSVDLPFNVQKSYSIVELLT